MKKNILIADYDNVFIQEFSSKLIGYDFDISIASSVNDALGIVQQKIIDLAVIDLIDSKDDSGFILAYYLKKHNPLLPIIIISQMSASTGIYFNPASERERKWLNAEVYLTKDIGMDNVLKETFKLLKVNK